MKYSKVILSLLSIIAIIAVSMMIWKWMEQTQNKSEAVAPVAVLPKVKVLTVSRSDYTIYVEASGKVRAAKQAKISAEVGGAVMKVSDNLQVGEVLEKGDFMAEIDSSDYHMSLIKAKSSVADAKLLLAQEKAKAEQNAREWKRLGKGKPSDLVLRKPQLESAKARLLSSESVVAKAERDIEKTVIRAPYRMMIESKHIELGNLMSAGAMVAEGHSADELEVRLALTMADYLLIKNKKAPISLTATIGNQTLEWTAEYLRDEGRVDQATLTIPIIAKVLKNSEAEKFSYPPVHLFVKAKILAQLRKQIILLPRDAVRLGGVVFVADKQNRLEKRKVNLIYTDKDSAIVEGIEAGESVIVSPMESAIEGTELDVEKMALEGNSKRP